MGKKPRLEALDQLFETRDTFTLTDSQYEKRVGIPLPKASYYLLHGSALARKCKEKGFELSVQEKTVFITKLNKDSGANNEIA